MFLSWGRYQDQYRSATEVLDFQMAETRIREEDNDDSKIIPNISSIRPNQFRHGANILENDVSQSPCRTFNKRRWDIPKSDPYPRN